MHRKLQIKIFLLIIITFSFVLSESYLDSTKNKKSIEKVFLTDSTKTLNPDTTKIIVKKNLYKRDSINFNKEFEIEKTSKITELELKDLEINDIEDQTYQKYEKFLDKYYKDNFLDLELKDYQSNKKYLICFKLGLSSIFPLGYLSKQLNPGIRSGTKIITPYRIFILDFPINFGADIYFTSLGGKKSLGYTENYRFIHLTPTMNVQLNRINITTGIAIAPTFYGEKNRETVLAIPFEVGMKILTWNDLDFIFNISAGTNLGLPGAYEGTVETWGANITIGYPYYR